MGLKINPVTREIVPAMPVGRYVGRPVDELPNSYLRWVITQNFPKAVLEAAKKKLGASVYNDLYLNVSRHALDMFSKRFLFYWMKRENHKGDAGDGLATFVAKFSQEAWEKGRDVSKNRHQNDGIVKEYEGIQFVFCVNPNFPDYKEVVTVMPV